MSTMWMLWVAITYSGSAASTAPPRIDKELFPSRAQCMMARQAIYDGAREAGYQKVIAVCFPKSLLDTGSTSEEEQQPKLKFKEGRR